MKGKGIAPTFILVGLLCAAGTWWAKGGECPQAIKEFVTIIIMLVLIGALGLCISGIATLWKTIKGRKRPPRNAPDGTPRR